MSDKKCCPGPIGGANNCSEAVCIHTSKVYAHFTYNLKHPWLVIKLHSIARFSYCNARENAV